MGLGHVSVFWRAAVAFRPACVSRTIPQADAAHKLVSKLNPGLGNKYEKAKMMRDIQGAKNVTTVTGTGCARRFFVGHSVRCVFDLGGLL